MKIAFDLRPTQTAFRDGGVGHYSWHLVSQILQLDQSNEFLFLVLSSFPLPKIAGMESSRIRTHGVYRPRRPESWHPFFDRILLGRELRGETWDVFHAPYFLNSRPARGRFVLTVHDLIPLRYPEKYLWRADWRWAFRQVLEVAKTADCLITNSEATRADVEELLGIPKARMRVTYLGVDEAFFQSPRPAEIHEAKSRYGIDGEYILSVGFGFRKNLPKLVEAYFQLGGLRRDFRLVLAGRPHESEAKLLLALISKLKLEGQVLLPGLIRRSDLPLLYAGATLFVFPSLYEGFGLPPLEAMAAGCPVIASNRTSVPEVVGEAGLLTDLEDAEAQAAAMIRLLQDKNLREHLRRLGSERARGFSWRRTAGQTLQVYREISG